MSKLFFGGMPTKMDVDKLMTAFDPQPGSIIPYEEVEKLIDVKWKSPRFRTVTSAWRKRLFREELIQITAYGEAFHCLTADQAHEHGRANISRVGRAVRKTRLGMEAVNIDDLTSEKLKNQHQLARRHLEALQDAIVKSVKEIAAPVPHTGQTLRIAK